MKRSVIIALASIPIGLAILLTQPTGLSIEEARAAALALPVIVFWASAAIPAHITALWFILLSIILGVAPADVVLAGFHSTAMWLIFSGLIIAAAITDSGLGDRLAGRLSSGLNKGYTSLVFGVAAIGGLFSFLMPAAVGRIIIFIPFTLALADRFGFPAGSKGRTGLALAAIFGCIMPGFAVLTANVPNMVLVGMCETRFQFSPMYGEYLLLNFPVLGLLKTAGIVAIILWRYPDRAVSNVRENVRSKTRPSRQEWILSLILICLLLLWMFDFLHKISPAWIALTGAMILLTPGVQIVDRQAFNTRISYSILFYSAGILGFGGMTAHTGLGKTLAEMLIHFLPLAPEQSFINYFSLGMVSSMIGLAATPVGAPAVITPIADTLAQATGLPLKTVIMTQVLGYSTPIFTYQLVPLAVGGRMAGLELSEVLRFCLLLAGITIVILWPLNFIWWRFLGVI